MAQWDAVFNLAYWAALLEAWLALTSVKYHDNLLILMLINQWLALAMLRTTGPRLLFINWSDVVLRYCKSSNSGPARLAGGILI